MESRCREAIGCLDQSDWNSRKVQVLQPSDAREVLEALIRDPVALPEAKAPGLHSTTRRQGEVGP